MEKIIRPAEQIVERISGTPLSYGQIFDHGSTNINYKIGEKVIHISPVAGQLSKEEKTICNKWVYAKKSEKLAELQREAGSLQGIKVPQVHSFGEVEYQGVVFPFWIEDYISGDSLFQITFTRNLYGEYSNTLRWVADLHQKNVSQNGLRQRYYQRLGCFKRILGKQDFIQDVDPKASLELLRIVSSMTESVKECVDEEETISMGHGDLHGGNLIVSNGFTGVIDFEQGVNGTDWFGDIYKLLVIDSDELPNVDRPYKYRPNLTRKEKTSLLENYVLARRTKGWKVPRFIDIYLNCEKPLILKPRTNLFRFDNIFSTWCFRKLSDEGLQANGKYKRKSDFLLEMLINEYGRK